MSRANDDQELVKRQYATARNLNARIDLHRQFSTNKYGWMQWVFEQIELPDSGRVLELGCGGGGLRAAGTERIPTGCDITISDASAGMLEEASQTLRQAGLGHKSLVIDAVAIPLADAAFDVVIANHMLYHVSNLEQGLGEIRRVLRPGGRLYATTIGTRHLAELRELLRPVAPGLVFLSPENAEQFGLENGAAKLRQRFGEVSLRHYDDGLIVTEAEPLVDFVLSTRGAKEHLTEPQVCELRRVFATEIARKGAVRISKSQGMFIAS